MISSYISGGLGNMMFQIAAGFSHALDTNQSYKVSHDNMSHMTHSPFSLYESNIFKDIDVGDVDHIKTTHDQPSFRYHPIPDIKDLIIYGYFQSEKYFIKHELEIKNLFGPSKEVKDGLTDKYGDVSNYTSLHVRRGDYLQVPSYHPTCTAEYYDKALALVDGKVLVFSDDIDWCRKTFQDPRFKFAKGNLDYIDLYLMSMCKNNIIANSSFSWWAAWLNDNKDKKVIAPKNWFGEGLPQNVEDLRPNKWILI